MSNFTQHVVAMIHVLINYTKLIAENQQFLKNKKCSWCQWWLKGGNLYLNRVTNNLYEFSVYYLESSKNIKCESWKKVQAVTMFFYIIMWYVYGDNPLFFKLSTQ